MINDSNSGQFAFAQSALMLPQRLNQEASGLNEPADLWQGPTQTLVCFEAPPSLRDFLRATCSQT